MINPIVPGDVDQVALVHVLPAAQPSPSHAATVQDQRKAALHPFGAELERLPGHFGEQPGTVVVDRAPRGIVSMPAQEGIAPGLGDAALPRTVLHRLQTRTGMVAFVGHQLSRVVRCRCRIDGGQVRGRICQRVRHRRGVALVGWVHLGRNHRTGVEIHGMLGLVDQVRAAVLHPGRSARCSIRFPACASVTADGAYDGEPVYRAVAERQPDPPVAVVIPPRSTAVPGPNAGTRPSQRDQHIHMIQAKERLGWHKAVGYGKRSHAQTAMFRYKAIIGSGLRARTLPAQNTETKVACSVLNRMARLGRPMSQRIC